jgi:hypothetical protein
MKQACHPEQVEALRGVCAARRNPERSEGPSAAKDLGEPRDASRCVRRKKRAFGSLP